tara:strand:- start:26 stop:196 length:171 start_codon:yes stop_codon:yes gene_type:complete
MSENIFDRFDIGDLVKHTNSYAAYELGRVKHGNRNSDHLTKLIIIAKGKINDGNKR